MDGFKEFQGQDLASAIAEACGYSDLPREKLEIEILQDAKTGIFGIVGARKAKVRARRAQLREAVESVLGPRGGARHEDEADAAPEAASPRREEQARDGKTQPRKAHGERKAPKADAPATAAPEAGRDATPGTKAAPAAPVSPSAEAEASAATPSATAPRGTRPSSSRSHAASAPKGSREAAPQKDTAERAPASPRPARNLPPAQDLDADDAPEGLPRTPVEDLDPEKLQSLTEATVKELVRPITGGRVPVTVRVEDGRVRANVDWSGDAGLLIGREGQTLAALQYLASRTAASMP